MDSKPLQVSSVQVAPPSKNRTIRLDIMVKNGPDFSLEIPLATATRLTDQLVDAEFLERCGHELSSSSQTLLETPAASFVVPRRRPPSGKITQLVRQAWRLLRPGSRSNHI